MKKAIILAGFLFTVWFCYSQGIYNNNARIVFSGAAQVYIAGGTNGDYFSTGGGLIHPSATGIIRMEGDWRNNSPNTGFFSDNGTVILNGANQDITGTNSTTFYNLTLQGSGVKTQQLNTSVGGVTTTNGVLSVGNVIYNLNSNILTVTNPAATAITYGTGYILSETNAAINPSIVRWNMGTTTGAHVVPFGVAGTQIPLTFNKTTAGASNIDFSTRATGASDNQPWAGASNVGAVSFFFCPNIPLTGNPCAVNSVIDRWWDITPSAAVTANVTFSYRGVENTLTAPYNAGNIGVQWWDGSYWNPNNATVGSAPAVMAGVGNVTASGLSFFCPFVLSSVSVPLPVDMVKMDIACEKNGYLISWTTASETNSKYFIVERSEDGANFYQIATINAAGQSNTNLHYSYFDAQNNRTQDDKVFYYRVKEVDVFGNVKKYKVLSTKSCSDKPNSVEIANTSGGQVFITFQSSASEQYSIKIYDLLGKLIKEETPLVTRGLYKMQLETAGLPQSVYLLQVSGSQVQKSQKVLLNGL